MKNTKITPIFIIVLASILLASCSSTGSNTVSTTNATNSISSSTTSGNTTSRSKTISYHTDHGKENVSVTFNVSTTSDGTITGITANMNSGEGESREYIQRFNNAASRKIIGQKISSLSLSSVGGASDTTDAFLEAASSL